MAYKVVTNYVSSSKYSIKCPYSMTPSYITVHNTANDASARNEVAYMRNNNNQVSFHAAIDDKEVVLAIPFNRNAWHAGDSGKGTGNRKSIGIEICYSKSGGARFDAAERNAAVYIAGLLKARGWGIDRVKPHKYWSGKNCPHRTLERGWQRFLNMISAAMNGSTPTTSGNKPTPSASAPTSPYKVGKVYTLKSNMNVRVGAGTNYRKKKRSELTANARAHCKSGSSAVLKAGTRITCKAVKKVGSDIWLKIPSGYVCAKKGNKVYIK